jgi:SAM-dependent methyltransferase
MFANAEAYERFMGRWSRILAPLLVDFADPSDRGRVLDVGSGTGALAFSIAERRVHCQVLGVDPSTVYVSHGESRNPYPDRVSFEVGDGQQLRFPDATFENSLSLLVFNFIPDGNKALREISRVTKPGGCIAAAVWDYGAGMTMLRTFWDAAVAVDPTAEALDEWRMPLCRAGGLGELWKAGGLAQVEERPLEIRMRFESFADYWEPFLLGQGPAGAYLGKLDSERGQVLRSEVRRRLGLRDEDTAFSLVARAWAVRGFVRNCR